jgi:hypothetical protein
MRFLTSGGRFVSPGDMVLLSVAVRDTVTSILGSVINPVYVEVLVLWVVKLGDHPVARVE